MGGPYHERDETTSDFPAGDGYTQGGAHFVFDGGRNLKGKKKTDRTVAKEKTVLCLKRDREGLEQNCKFKKGVDEQKREEGANNKTESKIKAERQS